MRTILFLTVLCFLLLSTVPGFALIPRSFSLGANPNFIAVTQGFSSNNFATITAAPGLGFNGLIQFSCQNLGTDMNCVFDPPRCTLADGRRCSTLLRINAGIATQPRLHVIRVIGQSNPQSGSRRAEVSLPVVVASQTASRVSVQQAVLTIVQGESATAQLGIALFSYEALPGTQFAFRTLGLPRGVTLSFSPRACDLRRNRSCQSQVTISTAPTTPMGRHTILIYVIGQQNIPKYALIYLTVNPASSASPASNGSA